MKRIIALRYFTIIIIGYLTIDIIHRLYLLLNMSPTAFHPMIPSIFVHFIEILLLSHFILRRLDAPSRALLFSMGMLRILIAGAMIYFTDDISNILSDSLLTCAREVFFIIGLLFFSSLKYQRLQSS